MARFRFPLEGLLKARRMAEREQQRVVAAIERDRLALEEALRRQQQTIALGRQSLRDSLVGTLDAHLLRMHAASSLHHMRQAQRLVLELAGAHKRVEAARATLVEAARARRAIELLRERRLAQWRQEQDKAETAAMDELAVQAEGRNRRVEITDRSAGISRR